MYTWECILNASQYWASHWMKGVPFLMCAGLIALLLQCVAVCCSVLQCAAVCCSVLQCVAVCCSVLQCAAVCCSVLQCVAVCCSRWCTNICRTLSYTVLSLNAPCGWRRGTIGHVNTLLRSAAGVIASASSVVFIMCQESWVTGYTNSWVI